MLAADSNGVITTIDRGLQWRREVYQQIFEEAAIDCGRALASWTDSRSGNRKGRRTGFPRFKKKSAGTSSFRVRNRQRNGSKPTVRIGENGPRSITLPKIGPVSVFDDTRRLRRMLAKGRARILFATITAHAERWWVSVTVEAAELHVSHRHNARREDDNGGWIGVDRGLSAFVVAADGDGRVVRRISFTPKPMARGMDRLRRLQKSLSRKQNGSRNRQREIAKIRRHHHHISCVRGHFLHQVSNELVKTHDRLVLEDLNVSAMVRNRRLARAISDAGWADFARLLRYKQAWRGGQIATADRWFPSSKLCPSCGSVKSELRLADRLFMCECGHTADRDVNAAVNLARWAQLHHDKHQPEPRTPKRGGRATNARRQEGSDRLPLDAGETSLGEAGTEFHGPPAV